MARMMKCHVCGSRVPEDQMKNGPSAKAITIKREEVLACIVAYQSKYRYSPTGSDLLAMTKAIGSEYKSTTNISQLVMSLKADGWISTEAKVRQTICVLKLPTGARFDALVARCKLVVPKKGHHTITRSLRRANK